MRLIGDAASGTKNLFENNKHAHSARIDQPVMKGLRLAAEVDESIAAQLGKMLRQGGLAKPQGLY